VEGLEVAERVAAIVGQLAFVSVILWVVIKARRNPDEMRWRQ